MIEPSSDTRQLALAMFEAYTAFTLAGFSEEQALKMIQALLGKLT